MRLNLADNDNGGLTAKKTGRSATKFFISPLVLAAVFVASFVLGRVSLTEAASYAISELNRIPIIGQMSHLISSPDRKLVGESEDRINILLVGMGGEGHDGPNLTDTIIVASVRPSDKSVAMLSIPRDLLVPVPNHGWQKINSVNSFGEIAAAGRGGELVRTTIEGLLGIDIPYYARIDFSGFKSVIDGVGGLEIYVDRAFEDYNYPTYDRGIQHVSFKEGWQTMDGETALRYARSRHGNNGEGSDFARSNRQQKVLAALKRKLTTFNLLRSPVAITNTLASLRANVTTNLDVGEILRLARMAKEIDQSNVKHKVLDNGPDSPLVDSSVNGAYVLLPRDNDWNLLRDAAKNLFDESEPVANAEMPPPTEIEKADASVEIRNGCGKAGIARDAAGKLSPLGFTIVKIGNADSFNYKSTVIFDLTGGKNDEELELLKQAFPKAAVNRYDGSRERNPHPDAQFIVVLGEE